MRIAHGKRDNGRRKGALLCGLVLMLMVAPCGTSFAQTGSNVAVAPPLWKVDPIGQGATLPTTCSADEDHNTTELIGYPLLDGGPTGIPGWVFGTEVALVQPHVMNRLFNTVTRASGVTDTVQLPSAQIETAIMPRFDLGYRFGQAAGELLVSYRVLDGAATNFASGNIVPAFGPGGVAVASRLSLNTLDIDYGSWEPKTFCGVDLKWRVGLRAMWEFNNSQAAEGALNQSTANDYYGFGPHTVVDFRRPIFHGTGLALYSRLEAAFLWGTLRQTYTESVGGDYGETDNHLYTQVLMFGAQLGVHWVAPFNPCFQITAGYVFEHTWDLGTLTTGVAAREELDINGGFVRAEWNY